MPRLGGGRGPGIDLGDLQPHQWHHPPTSFPTWKISSPVKPLEGAKTVLVSATGPRQGVVFSLDITDPSSTTYPLPMWEFDLGQDTVYTDTKGIKYTVESAFTDIKPAAALARYGRLASLAAHREDELWQGPDHGRR